MDKIKIFGTDYPLIKENTPSANNSVQSQASLSVGQSHVASVEQDLAAMAKETGTVGFSYNDIHNSGVDTAMHNDYKKVINSVAKANEILPMEAEKKLLECGALTPLPNGEYMVNVGYSTRNGGGRNKNGVVFFTASNEDVHSQYHEMAHSYQKKDNLFGEATIDKMYSAAEKGLGTGEQGILADRNTYQTYLKETHSEIFAQTSLMLREESYLGFVNQALYAKDFGDSRNAEGLMAGALLDKGSADKAKLYACKPVMDAAIKEVAAIRKQGKRTEYFNADGTLNAQKVSKLCEKITLENAYSPRTYKSFLDNNLTQGFFSDAKDWKKGSFIALARYLPAKISMGIQNAGKNIRKKISGFKHSFLRRNDKSALQKMTAHRKMSDNPQIQAANDYAYIQAKMLLVAKSSGYQNGDDFIDDKLAEMNKNNMSAADLQQMAKDIKAPKALKDLKDAYSIMVENRANPYFQALMENPANYADMRYGKSKVAEKSNGERTSEMSLSDREKIAALSGISGAKTNRTALSDEEVSSLLKESEISQTQPETTPEISAQPKDLSDMSDKEKIAFLSGRGKTKSDKQNKPNEPVKRDYKALMQGNAEPDKQDSPIEAVEPVVSDKSGKRDYKALMQGKAGSSPQIASRNSGNEK